MSLYYNRMNDTARAAYDGLATYQQNDVDEYLKANPREELFSAADVVNAFLVWNGIIGYTDAVVGLVFRAYGLKE